MALTWAESYLGKVRSRVGDSDTILFVGARGVILDEQNRLLGAITVDDVLDRTLPVGWRQRRRQGASA